MRTVQSGIAGQEQSGSEVRKFCMAIDKPDPLTITESVNEAWSMDFMMESEGWP